MEMKLDNKRMEGLRHQCGFLNGIKVGTNGTRGELCLAWKEEIFVSLWSFSSNFINVLVEGMNEGIAWRLIGFYGSS